MSVSCGVCGRRFDWAEGLGYSQEPDGTYRCSVACWWANESKKRESAAYAQAERDIAAWLRANGKSYRAKCIERGDHRKEKTNGKT